MCTSSCGAPAAAITSSGRELSVEILYIDIDTCDRCQGADTVLRRAIAAVHDPLAAMGVSVRLTETLVATAEQASERRFRASPTIRIDGHDIQADPRESECGACSALPNQSKVDCREWSYNGQSFTAPPEGLLVEALLLAALAPKGPATEAPPPYVMPDNLRAFFKNKAAAAPVAGSACGCS